MFLLAKDTVKFAVLVGLSGIFIDAVIAHGLFWDNDPYWTYWVTKSFLITSVFLFGTAFLGIGILPGLILTAAHTAILEIYYQWLAPVGLPQEPEWLDFNHLWVTGVPAHFLAIFAGYLLALWLWRRNRPTQQIERAQTWHFAVYGLLTTVLIVAVDGVLTQMLLLRHFPGVTFFVQHTLIGFVFVCAWTAYAGVGRVGWIVGSLMLALVWVAYNMYLGPRGLPLRPPTYSGYEDLWWWSFPGAFVSALLGWWLGGYLMKMRRKLDWTGVAMTLLIIAVAYPVFGQTLPVEKGTNAMLAGARASGQGMRVVGPDPTNLQRTQPISGEIIVETSEMGNRWSHVQNTDGMRVRAVFTSGSAQYEITVDKSMPRHPLGLYTTWSGVVYDHEMHGDTGIGTGKLPKMKPEIALWGWGSVKRDGQVIAAMAPVHIMVSSEDRPMPGIMLEVDTEDKALTAEPDGYIHVMWPKVGQLQMPTGQTQTRMIIGWIAMVGIVGLFGWLAYSERGRPHKGVDAT
ncbi:hypothetical protein M1D34_32265 (plasmid) [Ensifer sp. D2-11]